MKNLFKKFKKRKKTISFKNLPYSLHYSFIVLIFCSYICGLFWHMFLYFLCLILHESAHAYVAKKRGYKIGKIKLMATGAVLEAESDEFSFNDEIKIALAGPCLNLLLVCILIVVWWIKPEVYNFTQDLLVINLAIFAFNILPIFPLDGARILLGMLSKNIERRKAVKFVKIISIILACLIFMLFLISLFSTPVFSLGIIAVTLFAGVISEDKNAVYKRIYLQQQKIQRTEKYGIEQRVLFVSKNLPVRKLLKLIDLRHFTIFNMVDENMNVVKVLTENQVVQETNKQL